MIPEFKPSGPMTQETVPALQREAMKLVSGQGLRVDLEGVTELDSSSLALLLALRRSVTQQGASFEVVHVPDSMRTLARLYNVDFLVDNRAL